MLIHIAGLPTSPTTLFKHRRRRSHLVIQGRFREPVPLDAVLTGQTLARPLTRLPSPWLMRALCHVARRLSPSLVISERSLLAPICASAQAVHVAAPGQEPALTDPPQEDMRLCSPVLSLHGEPLPTDQRRRLFASAQAKRARPVAAPDHVYTFHFWQHLLDLASLQLATPIYRIDLATHLDGQPLQLLACTRDGRAVWAFEARRRRAY
ncbi:hypothetical protein WJX81_002348 [Elliptochloris bilobata]|uniref:Domain of unknown function at the cortex 1 domain-containing protein n=1 Tax=Elliptochloris bilobata TaxID=381761 RepID=A0AAW1SLC1_9CHLO